MKILFRLLCIFSIATAAFADEWLNFSNPFPIKSAIPSGEGLLMATGGGIRYRTNVADDMYTTSSGLGDQSVSAVVATKDAGVFSVSDNGIISLMVNDPGQPNKPWVVQNRSYAGNNVRVIPGMVLSSGSVLVIAFEDRLSFFSFKTMSSILTVERISDAQLSATPVSAMDIRGDSLFVAAGGALYVRKMNWNQLESDTRLYDPESWRVVKKASGDGEQIKSIAWKDGSLKTFATEGTRIWDKDGETRVALDTFSVISSDAPLVVVRGKSLKDSILYERVPVMEGKVVVRYCYRSKVQWVSLLPSGKAILAGPYNIFYYDGKNISDLTTYDKFAIGGAYELQVIPQGGVIAASDTGLLSYYTYDGKNYGWSEPTWVYERSRNSTNALAHNMKVLSVDPATRKVIYHIWGAGFFTYFDWGKQINRSILANSKDFCMDNINESDADKGPYTVAVATTLAPDGSGFLTTSASYKGYSLLYIDLDGKTMSCVNNVGSTTFGGPLVARLNEKGDKWIVYVGTRTGASSDANGGMDVFTFPSPNRTGGELDSSQTEVKKIYGTSSTPLDLVYEPRTGYVWIVTASSIAYWNEDQDSIRSPLSTNGLTSASFTSLDVDNHGNLWAGTSTQGVYRLTPRTTNPDTLSVLHFTTRQGLLSDKVQDVAVDSTLGMVWFAHDNGVSRYQRDELRSSEGNMTDDARHDVKVFPNPFRPRRQPHVVFDNVSEDAVINVFNRGGRLVVTLSGEDIAGGRAEWNGRLKNGEPVAPGVYQYVIRAKSKVKKGKLLIIH